MLRQVKGVIRNIDGSPWLGRATFRLFPGSYDLEAQYPSQKKEISTSAIGEFEILLWCNTTGLTPSRYECFVGGDRFVFDLPPGVDPVNIGDLRAIATPPSPPVESSLVPVERLVRQENLSQDQVVVDFPKRSVPVSVIVSNNLDQEVQPTNVVFISDRAARVSLEGYTPITGIWRIRVL